MVVTLGQVTETELRLEPATVEVAAITTIAEPENALLSPSRTGPLALVDSNFIRNLPSINRNWLDFTKTNSLVNGLSIAGQSDRYFRVLFVTTGGDERLRHLLETAATLAVNPQRSLVYAVSLVDYLACPEAVTAPGPAKT